MANAKVAAIGTQAAQPASGSVTMSTKSWVSYPEFYLEFDLDAAQIPVTDAAGSGSYGALNLFTFNNGYVNNTTCIQNYTAFAEGTALTGGAGDAAFDIGIGSVSIAAAADGALTTTSDDIGDEIAVTLSGGTGTGSKVTGVTTPFDGTSTADKISLNMSGTAATIDASSTLDVTGKVIVKGTFIAL
jgi:hypothetical protein